MAVKGKQEKRVRRHLRVRKKVLGTPERPRLCVFRSLNHIYAQVVDDNAKVTLAHASSTEPALKETQKSGGNIAAAQAVGSWSPPRRRWRKASKRLYLTRAAICTTEE